MTRTSKIGSCKEKKCKNPFCTPILCATSVHLALNFIRVSVFVLWCLYLLVPRVSPCADPEGGGPTPHCKNRNIGFLSNSIQDPLQSWTPSDNFCSLWSWLWLHVCSCTCSVLERVNIEMFHLLFCYFFTTYVFLCKSIKHMETALHTELTFVDCLCYIPKHVCWFEFLFNPCVLRNGSRFWHHKGN